MRRRSSKVSVLFSEPKIPQWRSGCASRTAISRFSALQRAENSSIDEEADIQYRIIECFSALQRAENSSIASRSSRAPGAPTFQCSSASRKFLNRPSQLPPPPGERVSVLFSEPKIPQSRCSTGAGARCWVSVLFSEPKIPQCAGHKPSSIRPQSFSALQRAENSSMLPEFYCPRVPVKVSVLFSEPKIPQFTIATYGSASLGCFSALQRAENSSILTNRPEPRASQARFSALQRAENSSIAS